ncbi:CalY family protein [Haloarcula sp. S1AR25-5A]|uniref:CalY family protein n=1 Tax=Haloarcula terrestris TaxID=2950533 RepID=A0AAE4F004_9EURY|nr:TasA family protein [Haloarcula terrestris]MDS0223137.1 CalY family protein [Haloarcula terrestris]
MNQRTGITRRQLLGGLITVGAGSAATGAGTMAYFSDSESSTGNQISAGTLNLGFTESASFSFSTALPPGETTTDTVTLVNSGTISGSLDVDFDYAERDSSQNDTDESASAVAENLAVKTLTYDDTDHTGQITTDNPSPTLVDLADNAHGSDETTQNDLVNLDDPGNSGKKFTIGLELAESVGNSFQGDGVEITVTFHLNQNDSQ